MVKALGFFPGGITVKSPPANGEDAGDACSVPGSERSPGGGNANPLQYSRWENSTQRTLSSGLQSVGPQRLGHDRAGTQKLGDRGEERWLFPEESKTHSLGLSYI